MALSPQQEVLVEHPWDKSGRVLAGPGTGKTYTSVLYLEKLASRKPGLRVGYITFTRVVTDDFKDQLNDSNLSALKLQHPMTMHGYSLKILQNPDCRLIPQPLRIPDDWEQSELIRPDISRLLKAAQHQEATPTKVAELEAELSASFRSLRNEPLPIEAKEPGLVKAYEQVWGAHRRQYGYTLLSELSHQAATFLAERDKAKRGIDLLIVDEYQDLNAAEQQVLLELHRQGVAILAIGDDDQSIYGWRNAAPEGIRDFPVTFDAEINYPLTICRRSGNPALEIAAQLIAQEDGRAAKPPLEADVKAPTTEFRYLSFPTRSDEAAGVARIAFSRIDAGVPPKKIAVLVRSDLPSWSSVLQPAFNELNVPLAAPADIDSILGDTGVRRALALGHLIRNEHDSLAWRALLELETGIGVSVVDEVFNSTVAGENFAQRLLALYGRGFEDFHARQKLCTLIQRTLEAVADAPGRGGPTDRTGWAAWLAERAGTDHFSPTALKKFLAVGDTVGKRNRDRLLNKFQTTLRELASASGDSVRLMTMGMSKGLTFDTTIVVGVEEGNVPDPDGELAEERRYLYVALTRAKAMTVVTYVNQRTTTGGQSEPRKESPFMRALKGVELQSGVASP